MNLSRNPSVWRVALAAVVAAGIQVGLLTPQIGDRLDGTVAALAQVVTIVLPVIGVWWSRQSTLPVPAGSPPAELYERGSDGLYRPAAGHRAGRVPPIVPGSGA